MRTIRTSLALLALAVAIVSVGLLGALPQRAYAQAATTQPPSSPTIAKLCANNNPNCLVFDPAKNPMLKDSSGKAFTPSTGKTYQDPETKLTCEDFYDASGALYNTCQTQQGLFQVCPSNITSASQALSAADSSIAAASKPNCTYSNGYGGSQTYIPGIPLVSAGKTTTTIGTPTGPQSTTAPDASAGSCSITNLADCLINAVGTVIIGFADLLLGFAGGIFNWLIVRTVFQFASFLGNTPGVLAAWGILRDLGNIALLFGFVFMGIATVLELQTYAMKKALPGLIIFAICINFSLFAADVVIDTANVFSSAIYAQANTTPCLTSDCNINIGLASRIMQSAKLSTVYNFDTSKAPSQIITKVVIMILLALFTMIGAVVLLSASIMLLIRAAVLTFLMVLSPIGFAGGAIAPLAKSSRQWWRALVHQAFYAPIMLLLIYISLKITDSFSQATNGQGAGNLAGTLSLASAFQSPNVDTMGVVMLYLLSMAFLMGSLIFANKFGAAGAKFATTMGTRATFGLGNLTTQATSRAARFGVQHTFGNTAAGRAAVGILRYGEKGALDFRRLPGMKQSLTASGAGKAATASDTYGAVSGAYEKYRFGGTRAKEEKKLQDEELRDIKFRGDKDNLSNKLKSKTPLTETEQSFVSKLSTKELEKLSEAKKGNETLAKALSPDQFENLMKSDGLTETEKQALATGRFKNVLSRSPEEIRNISNKDLQQLAKSDDATFKNLVEHSELSSDQFNNLMKSDNITDSQKQSLVAGRFGDVLTRSRAEVRGISSNDLQQLAKSDDATFRALVAKGDLSDDQSENLMKSDSLTAEQKEYVRAQTPVGKIEALVKGTPTAADLAAAATLASTMSPKNKIKLSGDALVSGSATTGVMSTLTTADLSKLSEEGKLSKAQKDAIVVAIKDKSHPNFTVIDKYLKKNAVADAYWT